MTDDNAFEPRLGRMRSASGNRSRSYLGRVIAATNLARGAGSPQTGSRSTFAGARMGRAAGFGRVLASRGPRGRYARRVIVKASIVKLAGKGAAAAAAHLRYLQRDGTTREGARGVLYGRDNSPVDARQFFERGAGDRHQFRLIVSPEDGAQYDDLKPLIRRLMARVETDLGTPLDWVAVDHHNTGHPHTHVLVRGKDHRGADLVIAREYLTVGIRERAADLVEFDLGPRSAREIDAALRADIERHRFTSIDRALLREAGSGRVVDDHPADPYERAFRLRRLATLQALGLAEPLAGGRWRLADDMRGVLVRLGERGDIVRTMQRELTARRLERAPAEQTIYDPAAADARPLVGKVIARGLVDEHRDRHFLILDGVDGRSHFVVFGTGDGMEPLAENAIVRIEPHRAGARAVDLTVARVAAANGGRYEVEAHLRHDRSASRAFAESHVRRLEAIRRATGGVAREPSGAWVIADDHLERAAAYEARKLRDRPVAVETLSVVAPIELAGIEAATWLDKEIASAEPVPLRAAGVGAEIAGALAARRQWLVERNWAEEVDGTVRLRSGTMAALRQRELVRAAGQLAQDLGVPVSPCPEGATLAGIVRRRVDLVSGRFALLERSHDFVLVPWRPVLEPQIGKKVSGLVRGDRVTWHFGRERAGPTIG